MEDSLIRAKSGKVDYRNDIASNLNVIIAKMSFSENAFVENFRTFIEQITNKKPERFKGKFFKAAYIKSTQGKSFRLHVPLMDPKHNDYFGKHLEKYQSLKFGMEST